MTDIETLTIERDEARRWAIEATSQIQAAESQIARSTVAMRRAMDVVRSQRARIDQLTGRVVAAPDQWWRVLRDRQIRRRG